MPLKFQIKPPQKSATINVQETWQQTLEPAILSILDSCNTVSTGPVSGQAPPPQIEFGSLYDSCYRICIQGNARTLHKKYSEFITDYFAKNTLPQVSQFNDFINQTSTLWQSFKTSMQLISDIFMYLNRSFCEENSVLTTYELTIQQLHDTVIKPFSTTLVSQYLRCFNEHNVDSENLSDITDLFLSIKIGESTLFETQLKPQIFSTLRSNYHTQFDSIRTSSGAVQLKKLEEWLATDFNTKYSFIPPSARHEMRQILETEIIGEILPQISRTHITQWINEMDISSLKIATELEKLSASNTLVKLIGDQISIDQEQINSKETEFSKWVDETANILNKYHEVCLIVNEMQWPYILEIRKTQINKLGKADEFLALYVDQILKKNNAMTDEELVNALDKSFNLYLALQDHESFGQQFQRLFARRLLNNSFKSKEFELLWINKLKEINFNSDAVKYEKMISNIEETRLMFHGSKSIGGGVIQTNVDVLSKNLWPRSMQPHSKLELTLPEPLTVARSKFEEMYKSVKPDRSLVWNYNLSHAEMKLNLGAKSYLVSCPLICLSILNCFNEDEELSSEEISNLTGIPRGHELERHLKTLYLVKGSDLLLKVSHSNGGTSTSTYESTEDIHPNDKFTFNKSFQSSKPKIKIKVLSNKVLASANKQEIVMQEQEKLENTELTVMRIMKVRQKLPHPQLVHLTANNIENKFQPSLFTIKKAIQNMLNANKLAKTSENTYQYLE